MITKVKNSTSGLEVLNYAALRLLTNSKDNRKVVVGGSSVDGDGGGGLFYWDASSTATDDNGTVIKVTSIATGRFLRDHNPNYVKVKWFDAKGDGIVDDTTPISKALNHSAKTVDFESYSYDITAWSTLTTTTEKHLIGDGATIIGTSSRFLYVHADLKSSGIAWIGFTHVIFGNTVANSAPSITLKIKNSTFNACISPIDIEGAYSSGYIRNNLFTGCKGTVIRIGRNQYSEQEGWKEVIIHGNIFKDTVAHPTSTTTDTRNMLIYGKYHSIANNIMNTIVGQGTSETHGIYTKARWTQVSDNVIVNISVGSTISAINIKGSASGVTATPQGHGCNVSNNTMKNTVVGIRNRCSDTIVEGNKCTNVNLGIEAGSADNSRSQYIGNYLYGDGAASSIGINASVVVSDIVAKSNTIINFLTGVKVGNQSSGDAEKVSIHDNIINNSTTAFQIFPAGSTTLSEISIIDNIIDTATTMLRFETGGVLEDVTIRGNKGTNITTYVSSTGATAFPKIIDFNQIFNLTTTSASLLTAFSVKTQDPSAYLMQADVLANESTGADRASYSKRMLAYNTGGTTAIQGTLLTLTPDIESDTTWGMDLAAAGQDIRMRVLGAASTTINWKAELSIKGV